MLQTKIQVLISFEGSKKTSVKTWCKFVMNATTNLITYYKHLRNLSKFQALHLHVIDVCVTVFLLHGTFATMTKML